MTRCTRNGPAELAGDRADVDDLAATLALHQVVHRLGAQVRTSSNHVDLTLEGVVIQLFERGSLEHSSVVDQDVDAAESIRGSANRAFDVGAPGHVRRERESVAALYLDGRDGIGGLDQVERGYARACFGQCFGDRSTDPATGAGDQSYPTVQIGLV